MDKLVILAVAVALGMIAVGALFGITETAFSGPLESTVSGLMGTVETEGGLSTDLPDGGGGSGSDRDGG